MDNSSISALARSVMQRIRSSRLGARQQLENADSTSLDFDYLFGDLGPDAVEDAKSGTFPFLFSVVSWGCAATEWLATTLNSHSNILCFHCANMSWNKFGKSPPLDGWEYLRVVGVGGSSYAACGDVHGISREAIPDLRAKLGKGFNCAVLVREPLPRLRSQIALFNKSKVKKGWNVDYVKAFIDKGARLPEDNIDNRLFLHGANMLNNIIHEERIAPVWRSEDLTTDAAILTRFVYELTRGRVQIEQRWAKRAVERPPTNRHVVPGSQEHQFDSWQIEAIRKIVEPRAWEIYQKIGYMTPDFIG